MKRADAAREMTAYDRLPRAVRACLAASRFDFRATAIAADRRTHRLDAAETLAFIRALERWATEAEREAVCRGGNRLEADNLPRVDEMVQMLRMNGHAEL